MIYWLSINLTTVFWGLFRPHRVLIVPNFVIGCILLLLILIILFIISYVFIVGRYVRVLGLKRPQKTSNVSVPLSIELHNTIFFRAFGAISLHLECQRFLCFCLYITVIPCNLLHWMRGLGYPLTRKGKIHHNETQVWKPTGDNRGESYLQNLLSKMAKNLDTSSPSIFQQHVTFLDWMSAVHTKLFDNFSFCVSRG